MSLSASTRVRVVFVLGAAVFLLLLVILTDMADFYGFEEVWQSYFQTDPPVRTVFQGGLVNPGCIVEIDVIALTVDSGLARETIQCDAVASSPLAESAAIRAGEWVFLGGQMATDYLTGVEPSVRIDPNFPRYDTAVRKQGRYIIDALAALLEEGGSSLDRLVSLWAYVDGGAGDFRDMRDPPAMTLAGTRALPVPGCQLIVDGIAFADHRS